MQGPSVNGYSAGMNYERQRAQLDHLVAAIQEEPGTQPPATQENQPLNQNLNSDNHSALVHSTSFQQYCVPCTGDLMKT